MNRRQFAHPTGDHMRLLKLYRLWRRTEKEFAQSKSRQEEKKGECVEKKGGAHKEGAAWCYEHYVKKRSMFDARRTQQQLKRLMMQHNLEVVSCKPDLETDENCAPVLKSFLAGFFTNLGVLFL